MLETDASNGKRKSGFEQLQDCCRQRLLLSNLFGCAKNYYGDIKEEFMTSRADVNSDNRLIFGNRFDGNAMPIREIKGETGPIIIEGEVFS